MVLFSGADPQTAGVGRGDWDQGEHAVYDLMVLLRGGFILMGFIERWFCFQALIRRQLELEEEIEIKANTLFIDETECQGMRKSICIQAY